MSTNKTIVSVIGLAILLAVVVYVVWPQASTPAEEQNMQDQEEVAAAPEVSDSEGLEPEQPEEEEEEGGGGIQNTIKDIAAGPQQGNNGTISGTLMFPSESIPAQIVCAEDIVNMKPTCVETANGQSNFSLQVPAGNYYVYAQLKNAQGSWIGYKAYYNNFVTCGLAAHCNDRTKIVVKVEKDKTASNIKPHDWYDSN